MNLRHRCCALLLALLLTLNLSACQRRVEPEPVETPTEPPLTQEEAIPAEPEKTPEIPSEPAEKQPSANKREPYIFPSERDYPDSEAGAEQKAFDEFILEEFISSLEDDYLSIHNTLMNPDDFGIDKFSAQVSIGDGMTEEYIAEAIANNLELKEQFEAFRYDLLTEEQQETYKVYEYLLESAIASFEGDFPYMSWEFSPMQGFQNDIVSILMEFEFYSVEDVDAYMAMMRDIPRYAKEALEFSRKQERMGYFMPDSAAHASMDYCEDIIRAGEDSALLSAVLYNLENCDLLTAEQKEQYCSEAREFFLNELIPCYQEIYDTLDFLTDDNNNQMGLAYLKNGKEYYEYLFRKRSGSDRSVEEAKELLQSYLKLAVKEIRRISRENPDLSYQFSDGGSMLSYSGLSDILLNLEEKVAENFPYIDPVDYSISYLDSEVAVDGIGAYYVVPPQDSDLPQKIKVNPNGIHSETSLSTYTLLAHEGLPGHLYQTNYSLQNISEPFRKTVSIIGYSEGYATYAELISMNYLDEWLEEELITLEQCQTVFSNCMIALCDIGIHYDGWTLEELENFCGKYINMQNGTVLYEQLLGDPAAFQSYYMGMVEFLELRREAKEALGARFDETAFHETLLEGGDVPFSLLREKVAEYIAEHKN